MVVDNWTQSDQVMAKAVADVMEAIADPEKLPFLGSIRPSRANRCRRQLNMCAAYPTPLVIAATKNELVIEAAIQGTRPGGRVALLMKALALLTGNDKEEKKSGFLSRFFNKSNDKDRGLEL